MRTLLILTLFAGLVLPGIALAQSDGAIPIAYGDVIQETITDAQYEYTYQFSAAQGDVIDVSAMDVSSSYLNLDLSLRDAEGTVLVKEQGWMPIFLLGPYEIPADGDYFVHVERFGGKDGTTTGNFVLTVEQVNQQDLIPGTLHEGTLSHPAESHFWTFEAAADQIISITTTGTGLEFTLIDPEGKVPSHYGPGDDPSDEFVLLPEDGVYTLVLQTESLSGTAYTFTLPVNDPVLLEPDAPRDTAFTPDAQTSYYQLDSQRGELMRLEVASEDAAFDAVMRVYNSEGAARVYTYSSYEDAYELLLEPWVAPENGTYYLVIKSDKDVTAEIAYTVTLRASELVPLEYGVAAQGQLGEDDFRRAGFAIHAEEDQRVAMQWARLEGECTPEIRVRNSEKLGVGVTANAWADSISATITIPANDVYVFEIERGSYRDECTFEIAVNLDE